jgi:hypothetical protein
LEVVLKDELAERTLAKQMGWTATDTERLRRTVGDLQALARLKYDDYGMFRPGVKFLESLVGWLDQFEPQERQDALAFVLKSLIFLSFAEIDHLIGCVYPDFIRQSLLDRVARATGGDRFRVAQLAADERFRELQRRTLVLGLSDGARLDQLRRASPALSTEQFHPTYWVEKLAMEDRREALAKALKQYGSAAPNTFAQVVLVDDFSGSGFSMLRPDGAGSYEGKLWKIRNLLSEHPQHFDDDLEVVIVLYVATAQARNHVEQTMRAAQLEWDMRVVMPLPEGIRVSVTWPTIVELSGRYYDPLLDDRHKGNVPLGFENCELPLVLHHNTPNNSICLLWGDTVGQEKALPLRALFPRYERHHEERP